MMEYIIQVYKNDRWSLECICGKSKENAERVLAELQVKNPQGLYRIEATQSDECWWNTIGTH